jgi:DNA-binding CsgD family transcriptional regulator
MYNEKRAGSENRIQRYKNMYSLYCEGFTYEQIGRRYGISKERVRQVLLRGASPEEAEHLQFLLRKRRLGASEQAPQILKLLAEGRTQKQVAETVGVSVFAVKRVAKKAQVEAWKEAAAKLAAGEVSHG